MKYHGSSGYFSQSATPAPPPPFHDALLKKKGPLTLVGVELNINRHKHFRWTGRTAWITFTYVVVVPTIVGIMAYKTDVSREKTISPTPSFPFFRETRATVLCMASMYNNEGDMILCLVKKLENKRRRMAILVLENSKRATRDSERNDGMLTHQTGQMGNARQTKRRYDCRVLSRENE